MTQPDRIARILPLPLPDADAARIVLVMLRRMATHGLHDASAGLIALNHFGLHFRRPLTLLRAFVAELSAASQRPISIAPCCAMRMTRDEGLLLEVLALAQGHSAQAQANLHVLTGGAPVGQALSTAFALFAALGDLGQPLEG